MSGAKADKRTTGKKRRQQKKIFKKRTGITAFLSKEIFFTTSYNPNKVAETKASNNHIVSNINLSTIQFYKVGYASLRQSILRKKRKRFTACPNRRTIISALPMRYRNPTPASFIYKQDVYQKSGAKIKENPLKYKSSNRMYSPNQRSDIVINSIPTVIK